MTETAGHDWITFHRLRFPERVSALKRAFPQVAGPDCWLFGPHYDVGPDGMLTGVSDIWGGVGVWHSRDDAEAMVAAPGDHMPWLGETVAAWHCLSVPVSHRGSVCWRGYLQNGVPTAGGPKTTLSHAESFLIDAASSGSLIKMSPRDCEDVDPLVPGDVWKGETAAVFELPLPDQPSVGG
jgi:hypothetical protein